MQLLEKRVQVSHSDCDSLVYMWSILSIAVIYSIDMWWIPLHLDLLLQHLERKRETQRNWKKAIKEEMAELKKGKSAASEGSMVSEAADAAQESASKKDSAVTLPALCCCCRFSHAAALATLLQ